MLDPRIYRASLIAVVLVLFVFGFSLQSQNGPAGTTLAPEAFNGQNAYAKMISLARRYPDRRPGSPGDDDVATYVAGALKNDGFVVQTQTGSALTADGRRTIETVMGTRPGQSSGSIVVLAHRDSLGSPSVADLSGTAVLLELARVLSGETQQRTVILASTSGSAGQAGAQQLIKSLGTPVDAVIALGDVAGSRVREPVIVPWSDAPVIAPAMLRNTVAAALRQQANLRAGGSSLGAQVARLSLPMTLSEQGPFGAHGIPAVLLSLSGEQGPAQDQPIGDSTMITALGRTVLETVTALDSAPSIPAPSAYMLVDGKVVPPWAIKLMVLALILPVLLTMVDGLARARRRGHSITRWVVWIAGAALPFLIALGVTLAARLVGLLGRTPPGPVPAGAVPLGGSGVALLVVLGLVLVGMFFAWRPLSAALAGVRRWELSPSDGAAAALLLVLCVTTLVIWARNPLAAVLVVPALHLWMWVLDPDVRMPRVLMLVLLAIGIAPPVLVVLYYASTFGLGPAGVAWNGLLLIAGGQIGVIVAIEWSVLLGCIAGVLAVASRTQRRARPGDVPITVRGPVTYAGPGSLGGTESALRR
jgi:Peptidase family M28